MYTFGYVNIYVYVYLYVCVYVLGVCVCASYTDLCINIHIYVYMQIDIHLHTHIYVAAARLFTSCARPHRGTPCDHGCCEVCKACMYVSTCTCGRTGWPDGRTNVCVRAHSFRMILVHSRGHNLNRGPVIARCRWPPFRSARERDRRLTAAPEQRSGAPTSPGGGGCTMPGVLC